MDGKRANISGGKPQLKTNISGGKLPLKTPQTEPLENTLFPLEDSQRNKKKRSFPYRGYHPKRESSSNKRLWMELSPDPKKRTGQRPTEEQGTLWNDGELF